MHITILPEMELIKSTLMEMLNVTDLTPCTDQTCLNGGTCINYMTSENFTASNCTCLPSHDGDRCESKKDK